MTTASNGIPPSVAVFGRDEEVRAVYEVAVPVYETLLPTEGNTRKVLVAVLRLMATFGSPTAVSVDAGQFVVGLTFDAVPTAHTVRRSLQQLVELRILDLLVAGRSWKDLSGPARSSVFGLVASPGVRPDFSVRRAEKKRRRVAWVEFPERIRALSGDELAQWDAWRESCRDERDVGLAAWIS